MRAHVWYRVPRWLLPTLRTMPPFDDMAHCADPEHDAPIDATRNDVTPVGTSIEVASRDALLNLEAACFSVHSDEETLVWIESTIDAQGTVAECNELFSRAPAEVLRNPAEVLRNPAEDERATPGPAENIRHAADRALPEVSELEEALALEARTFELQVHVSDPCALEAPLDSLPPQLPPPPPPELPLDAEAPYHANAGAPRTLVTRDGEVVLALESHLTPRCLRLLATNRTSWPTEEGRFVAVGTSGSAVHIGTMLVDAGSYAADGVDARYEWKGAARAKRAPEGGPRGRIMRLVREKSRRRERR